MSKPNWDLGPVSDFTAQIWRGLRHRVNAFFAAVGRALEEMTAARIWGYAFLSTLAIVILRWLLPLIWLDVLWAPIWILFALFWTGAAVTLWFTDARGRAISVAAALAVSFAGIYLVIPWLGQGGFYWATERRVVGTVKYKEIDADIPKIWLLEDGRPDSDTETFKVTDLRWLYRTAYWQVLSSDLYGSFEVGKRYCVRVVGIRWGARSWFRTIFANLPADAPGCGD